MPSPLAQLRNWDLCRKFPLAILAKFRVPAKTTTTMKFALALALIAPTVVIAADLPLQADRTIDFTKDIQPLLEAACVKCHAKGKSKGGFSIESRELFLNGGDSGPGAEIGKSAESIVVKLLASDDPDERMPKKGTRWSPDQIGLLRAWIDQGAKWPADVDFAKPKPHNLAAKMVEAPQGAGNPIDRILLAYFSTHGGVTQEVVSDSVFARRVWLDTIGLIPTEAQLAEFERDPSADKRAVLVDRLLADSVGYAENWLNFWNDLLRNDYRGTGFIDGGRKQISGWLYDALKSNKPYDQFVRELTAPSKETEGFTSGILWRGNVNASMVPPMQAAQSVSQVFMGINLKCASCHDSFIDDWSLADAYGLAAVYSDEKLELVECDKPTGKTASVRFLYPEIGEIDGKLSKSARAARLAELLTSDKNGRLSRTIVNRLWARLLGRGLVEPLDNMDQPA
jgi:mono/diheme cytochrome c family protein